MTWECAAPTRHARGTDLFYLARVRYAIVSIILDHPRYGAPPLYYASCCDGFQDVFASDMAVYS